MAIKTKGINEWLAASGQAVANAAKPSLLTALNNELRPLQDGVYIGKIQKETGGTYMRSEPWQTTRIGIDKADADAVVIQFGGYCLGIALDEPADALPWGSVAEAGGTASQDMNVFDGLARTTAVMKNEKFSGDDPTKFAVAYCWNYSKGHTGDPGGDDALIAAHKWWLPTMGDLYLIRAHFETINLALARINGAGRQQAVQLKRAIYWSCQEPTAANARSLAFSNGYQGYGSKTTIRSRVRAVTAF